MIEAEADLTQLNQQLVLSDGRKLGFDERGPADGKPLLYFHGSPSSRIESRLYISDELLQSLDVRLIAADRPGLGLSDFQPARQLLDWPRDVLSLADHLKIERFAVLAYSLGGPYGLACAYAIPERLVRVGIVSGAALFTIPELVENINPGTRSFLFMPRQKPWLSRLYLGMMLGVMPRLAPKQFVSGASAVLPPPDREVVNADPAFREDFVLMVREAMRQGLDGAFLESLLTITDYGFPLEDIPTPILLWHGEEDQNIPMEMVRHMAEAIPKCEAKYYPGEGHLSLFKKHAGDILRTLVT